MAAPEANAIERGIYFWSFPREGVGGVEEGGHSGPHGKARGLFRRQKDHKESMAQSLIVFPAGKARQEKVS